MPKQGGDPIRHHRQALVDQKRWQALKLVVESSEEWADRYSPSNPLYYEVNDHARIGRRLIEAVESQVVNDRQSVDKDLQQTIWNRIKRRMGK